MIYFVIIINIILLFSFIYYYSFTIQQQTLVRPGGILGADEICFYFNFSLSNAFENGTVACANRKRGVCVSNFGQFEKFEQFDFVFVLKDVPLRMRISAAPLRRSAVVQSYHFKLKSKSSLRADYKSFITKCAVRSCTCGLVWKPRGAQIHFILCIKNRRLFTLH